MFNSQGGKGKFLSKSVEGLRLYSLQAKRLACYSSLDAGRKHKTLESEMKESVLLTATAVARVSAFFVSVPGAPA